MDESQPEVEAHDPYGAPDYARPEADSRRKWMIPAAVGVVVLAVGGFFGVKALAGGPSSTSTAGQNAGNAPAGANPGRRGTIGTLQSIDGSTLTVATFVRGQNGGAAAGGNTTTVLTSSSTTFYKTVSGALSDIKVGDRVTATGTPDGTDSVTAARITDTGTMARAVLGFGPGGGGARRFNNPDGKTPPPSDPNVTRPDPNSFANGTVKSITGSTITVTDNQGVTKTVTTNASTAVTVLRSVGINDLQTGQAVVVAGKTNSDGTVSATNVVQGIGGFGRGGGFGRFGGGGGGNGGPDSGPPDNPRNGTTTQ